MKQSPTDYNIISDGKLFYCESVYYEKECYTYSANDDTWVKTGVLPISSRGQQGAASDFRQEFHYTTDLEAK